MIKNWIYCIFLTLLVITIGCEEENNGTDEPSEFLFEFNSDSEGWTGGFSDYPPGEEDFYELEFSWSNLPDPLDTSQGALKLSGNNHSDDLFMYAKKKVSGFKPNQHYQLTFTVEFASNVADNMFGVGGSPGESVYIKAGASTIEPENYVDDGNWYRMNIDKNNQSQSGEDMIVIGDFSNDTDVNQYTLKAVTNTEDFFVKTNENGEFWLIVGTDSGFEATTTIYFNKIEVTFK